MTTPRTHQPEKGMSMSPEAAAEMGRIGAVAAMALAAIGSALGTYLGGAGAVGRLEEAHCRRASRRRSR